jgi:D-lactate dehydratase / protein deglycase
MGCCASRRTADGIYEPSCIARCLAVKRTTDYTPRTFDAVATGGGKVLVVATDNGRLTTQNGKVFASGNHPTETLLPLMDFQRAGLEIEFATVSGEPVVLEMWAFPDKDAAVTTFYNKIKPKLEAPTRLDDVDPALAGYAGIFVPGGHGAMVNLPDSVALGRLLRAAHDQALPTVVLCHGPAALLAAAKVEGAGPFPYAGYKLVTFTDKMDQTSPKIGYLPGQLPWLMQAALRDQGMDPFNGKETGATYVDRELVSGDSPQAANAIGKLAAPLMVAAWNKRAH